MKGYEESKNNSTRQVIQEFLGRFIMLWLALWLMNGHRLIGIRLTIGTGVCMLAIYALLFLILGSGLVIVSLM